jgi:hypothetical protein
MPMPEGDLIPVYMTELDWSTVLYLIKRSNTLNTGYASIIMDNIERQVPWSEGGPVK